MDARWERATSGDALRIGLCACAVVVVHGLAAALAGTVPSRRLPTVPGAAAAPLAVVARVVPHDSLSAREFLPPPLAEPAPRPAATAESAKIAAPTRADAWHETAARFYGFSEVDVAAEPETDWNVRLDLLDAAGVERVAFDVWIDDHGRILACSLIGTGDMAQDTRTALEADLLATVLAPAVRHGARVASHRRVEIYVDGIETSRDAR